MAGIGYCKGGGMTGLRVTTKELKALAKKLGRKYIDEFIPVPSRAKKPCSDKEHESEHVGTIYWETETGSHGWACTQCGKVLQWG